jgi:hypothetical protein
MATRMTGKISLAMGGSLVRATTAISSTPYARIAWIFFFNIY